MDVDPHQPITPHSPRRREKRKEKMKRDPIFRPNDASLPPKTFRQNPFHSEYSRLSASSAANGQFKHFVIIFGPLQQFISFDSSFTVLLSHSASRSPPSNRIHTITIDKQHFSEIWVASRRVTPFSATPPYSLATLG
ncbi:hypothetical protein BLNAU_9551 [Blattamonas nauphoetae]|uniref:Uncharacterized protein n=1 Tax=Blattamonas nauphoetae TaxID=2049346 RepID=A0ABQ9XVI9_9EUKA|nr:hypothetical protein BLNAU_9551 [Blattamonas nauphoetae]